MTTDTAAADIFEAILRELEAGTIAMEPTDDDDDFVPGDSWLPDHGLAAVFNPSTRTGWFVSTDSSVWEYDAARRTMAEAR